MDLARRVRAFFFLLLQDIALLPRERTESTLALIHRRLLASRRPLPQAERSKLAKSGIRAWSRMPTELARSSPLSQDRHDQTRNGERIVLLQNRLNGVMGAATSIVTSRSFNWNLVSFQA